MAAALAAAERVARATGDNPAVGCVVVKGGQIVAEGATQPPGGNHAEVMAVLAAEAAGYDLADCELFVTLEPCTFQGRTPPCSAFLARRRPRRVVVGIRDPHPRVRGRGVAELREAGIAVCEGVLAARIREQLADWLARFCGGPERVETG